MTGDPVPGDPVPGDPLAGDPLPHYPVTGGPLAGGLSAEHLVTGDPLAGHPSGADRLYVAYVLGTASGGTALHAGLLAEGCREAGLTVLAAGPASSQAAFAAGAASLRVPAGDAPGDGATAAARTGDHGEASISFRGPGATAEGRVAYHLVEIGDRPRPGQDTAAIMALRRLLSRAAPDVVHAHGLRAGALAALTLLAWRGRPALVVTVHNAPPAGRAARAVYAGLALACARRADVVLCASADLTARMRRYGARAENFAVPAPPAQLPSAADVARARVGLGSAERPVVLTVARLAEQKGLDTLLAAATRWQGRVPRPVLAIAGDGPLAARLAADADTGGVNLALLGRRDDVPALLAAADVVVVPSRWEARSLVVQEAMQAGRPIVASRVGGIPDLTGEDAAILVPPGDAGQLAAAVLALLDCPERAAGLAAGARRRAAALPGPADAVAAALALYARVTAARAGPASKGHPKSDIASRRKRIHDDRD